MTHLLVIGGNHWDERWIVSQPLVKGESIPVKTSRQPGGAAANMSRALKAEGYACDFASIYGFEAPPVLGSLITQVQDTPSARYVSLEDAAGKVLNGFADMEIYEKHMTYEWYEALTKNAQSAGSVVVDCNGPEGALAGLGPLNSIFALAVSPAKVRRLVPILDKLRILFCNSSEAQVLGADLKKVSFAVVTRGSKGAAIYEKGRETASYEAPDWNPDSANGLGDRLSGLVLSRVLKGQTLDQALSSALRALPC
ncbi:MAG: hypothetical protein ACPGRH_05975 [Alphaproteobacteria bacterium]